MSEVSELMSDPAAVDIRPGETVEELRAEVELTQRKLAEAHKMASLGRLSAGIVHEINTPIGSILSNNETIRRSLEALKKMVATGQEANQPLPPKATVILETLANLTDIDKIACERIYAVIRSLKTFARVNESDLRNGGCPRDSAEYVKAERLRVSPAGHRSHELRGLA